MESALLRIREADSPAGHDTARRLFREYATWLEIDLCFQGFEEELAALPGKYARPGGRLLLAERAGADAGGNAADAGGKVVGCVAVRPLTADPTGRSCELKRLWVRPGSRGLHAGLALTEAALAAAREIGYAWMKLDTLPDKMPAAVCMYRKLGFTDCAPYYHNPIAGSLYMELRL